MLPTYTALFEDHRWFCTNRGVRYAPRDLHDAQIGIARARLVAANLAHREEDEPAALLLALLLEKDALGDAGEAFPPFAVRAAVRRRGLSFALEIEGRIALRAYRARALPHRDAPDQLEPIFDELRAFVAARLRPLP